VLLLAMQVHVEPARQQVVGAVLVAKQRTKTGEEGSRGRVMLRPQVGPSAGAWRQAKGSAPRSHRSCQLWLLPRRHQLHLVRRQVAGRGSSSQEERVAGGVQQGRRGRCTTSSLPSHQKL
jgi:hypothetical protein